MYITESSHEGTFLGGDGRHGHGLVCVCWCGLAQETGRFRGWIITAPPFALFGRELTLVSRRMLIEIRALGGSYLTQCVFDQTASGKLTHRMALPSVTRLI